MRAPTLRSFVFPLLLAWATLGFMAPALAQDVPETTGTASELPVADDLETIELESDEPTGPEADDQRQFAKSAALYWDFEVNLADDTDVDWVHFSLMRSGLLSLIQKNVRLSQLTFVMQDAAGNELKLPEPYWRGDDLIHTFAALPIDYYLRISGTGSETPYVLLLDLLNDTDDSEPNDTAQTAVPATGTYQVNRHNTADEDWFALDLQERSRLTITIGPEGADQGSFSATLTDPETQDQQSMDFYNTQFAQGEGGQLALIELDAGKVLLQLSAPQVGLGKARVHFDVRPVTDPFEPNDQVQDAKPWALGEVLQGVQLIQGDDDWFYIDIERPGELGMVIGGDLTPWFEISRADGEPALLDFAFKEGQSDPATDSYLTRYYGDVTPGRYLVKISASQYRLSEIQLALSFVEANQSDMDTNFFMIALDTDEGILNQLKEVANRGGGEVLAVEANDLKLALSLGSVVAKTRHRSFGVGQFAQTTLKLMAEKSFRISDIVFTPELASKQVSGLITTALQAKNSSRDEFGAKFLAMQLTLTKERSLASAEYPADSDRLRGLLRDVILSPFEPK